MRPTDGTGEGREHEASASFEALYAAHRDGLFGFFLGRTRDRELALDLLQETYTRLWRHMTRVTPLAAEQQRAWIYTVARNLMVDHYRQEDRNRQMTEAVRQRERGSPLSLAAHRPDEALAHQEEMERLDAAIRRLPDDLRTVLVMTVVGGMNSREIAAALERRPGTIRYWLHKARQLLREDLGITDRTAEGGAG